MKVYELVPVSSSYLKVGDVGLRFSSIDFICLGTKVYKEGDTWLTYKELYEEPLSPDEIYCYNYKNHYQFRNHGSIAVLYITAPLLAKKIFCSQEAVLPVLKGLSWQVVKTLLWDSHFAANPVPPTEHPLDHFFKMTLKVEPKLAWTLSKTGVVYGNV